MIPPAEGGSDIDYMKAVFLVCLLASYPALVACQDTVYVACILNLDKDGPTVIDVPGGAGPGTVTCLQIQSSSNK